MRSLVLVFVLALALIAGLARAPAHAAGRAALHVALRPGVVNLYGQSTIAISGLESRSLEVRLGGATYADGSHVKWQSLRRVRGVWRGELESPVLRGLYRIELRTAHAGPVDTG